MLTVSIITLAASNPMLPPQCIIHRNATSSTRFEFERTNSEGFPGVGGVTKFKNRIMNIKPLIQPVKIIFFEKHTFVIYTFNLFYLPLTNSLVWISSISGNELLTRSDGFYLHTAAVDQIIRIE
ncbi:hypothetical protein AKO1_004436 [Acrasis kona]|uniref:Uncharacterized protein n=1 Tax=Acrasis kona TaxID=1008807 RepID=A0AAW2YX68_9EUKA